MEGFSMPPYNKRTARLQATPWALRAAALQAMESLILGPDLQPHQGRDPKNSHPSHPHDLHRTEPLRPAKPVIHRHWQSPLGHAPQACTISTPPACTPNACQASNPQAFTISTGPCPQACQWSTGTHNLCWATGMISTRTMPLKPAKPAIHRHTWSPLCQACPLQAHQVHAPKVH
jgi:hypothetical protein